MRPWTMALYPGETLQHLIQRVERQLGNHFGFVKFDSYKIGSCPTRINYLDRDHDFRVEMFMVSTKPMLMLIANLHQQWDSMMDDDEWFRVEHVHGVHSLRVRTEREVVGNISNVGYRVGTTSKALDGQMRNLIKRMISELEIDETCGDETMKAEHDSTLNGTPDDNVITGADITVETGLVSAINSIFGDSSTLSNLHLGYLTSNERISAFEDNAVKIFNAWQCDIVCVAQFNICLFW